MEWVVLVGALVFIFISFFIFFASRYKRCPSDRILVVFGKTDLGQASRCIHGGAAFVWPLIQDYSFLSLTPMTIGIPLQNALSLQNIRINVPSTFTVGISTNPAIMSNAAERLLGLKETAIEEMAREIIFGQLRLTVASLTIEQINQDRESFLEAIRKNVEPELNKVGLYLINVNITDITDESGYISALGKKAAAEAVNQAIVDVAEQEKLGAIGQAEAYKVKDVRVAENLAEAEKGKKRADADRRIYVQSQEAEAIKGENEAKASIAAYQAELGVREAEANQRGEVARREADVVIQKASYNAELERLKATEVVRQEIEKSKVSIAAEAEAEKLRREAKGEADAVLARYQAEAEGVRLVLASKAAGFQGLVASCGGDPRAAATLLLVEKIEAVVAHQVEAIKNLKIDKITVWDSGRSDGSGTAGFLSGLVKSLPPLQELAGMAGVELPEYLGRMAPRKERADEPAPEPAPGAEPETGARKKKEK